MGKKLDALLGRKFKTSKLKTTLNLAIPRLSQLKKHRLARFTIARSDVIQLLRLNHHQQALLRVEQVIKDQNMLDVYDMIHGYCNLLIQRINLIEQVNECPKELEEAVSNLLYGAPRCGEFPELQEIRAILTSRFGKEFADDASELRRNCGVSQTMIQKLSPAQSTLDCRMKILTDIAKENGIILQLDLSSSEIRKEKVVEKKKIEKKMSFSESKNYKDATDAAQDAFESAAYAAIAARAAVELARSESFVSDSSDSNSDGNESFHSAKDYITSQGQQVNLENKLNSTKIKRLYRQ
ncbi:unnamed protein product [Lactuca virosa]|uniref:Vacuolar protein sorting-associated protein Ist1 n=1 Tax=Lactuca virosa TaxID=75947 RepID=A0AAU9MWN4_9ASTR|nr:unnamed protein product [Lactuca virosa]